jgi:hypothetical protein
LALNNPSSPGASFLPAYQVSGIPFVITGSATNTAVTEIYFPYVTRDIYIKSRGDSLTVAFSYSGSISQGRNRFKLNASESCQLDLRVPSVFLMGTVASVGYEIVAGLTFIKPGDFPVLSASNGFTGVG